MWLLCVGRLFCVYCSFVRCFFGKKRVSSVYAMARSQRIGQLGGGFRSRASKLMAVCLGGVVLLSVGQAGAETLQEVPLTQTAQLGRSGKTQNGPTFKGQVARCELVQNTAHTASQAGATALTLSRDNLTATLDCSGENNGAVPEDLTNVCDPNQAGSANNCKFGEAQGSEGTEVPLQDLLGTSNDVAWVKESRSRTPKTGETWTLTLTQDDLPFTDKPFFVGCKENTPTLAQVRAATVSCKVPVHVEARPSSETNNVVTCAYGQNSNTNALEVELTAEKNAVTIDCGRVGSLMPEITTTHYCAPDDGNLDDCTAKKYVDVLPMFEESWVKQDGEKSSVTLTIPESGFPVEDQKLRLGCVPKSTSATKSDPESVADTFGGAKTSNCNVLVTVRASNVPSSAISTLQVAAVASGARAVAGLLAGSLF
ncbi:SRS domain-containing protein [Neospora caninum Liverpool]|uniref:SRS domain-containing protein n=1 Tax=Neospora caninum (strain Liverpool) TaxID=572307 RepID=F0VCV9_NEOCL|nr:SRS domain-containing protein [Neospora caninum Liverpool]CBZ51474.1 SRS domain-containing protein [Neospora caninum Liverpool]CEL65424.1 TPA: SRS domain-containing protein [Neospora caninum Liverpool]|eukprot:XP_003881507.1 SRS domain-containing protein [Neospora caninum Liverpool]